MLLLQVAYAECPLLAGFVWSFSLWEIYMYISMYMNIPIWIYMSTPSPSPLLLGNRYAWSHHRSPQGPPQPDISLEASSRRSGSPADRSLPTAWEGSWIGGTSCAAYDLELRAPPLASRSSRGWGAWVSALLYHPFYHVNIRSSAQDGFLVPPISKPTFGQKVLCLD